MKTTNYDPEDMHGKPRHILQGKNTDRARYRGTTYADEGHVSGNAHEARLGKPIQNQSNSAAIHPTMRFSFRHSGLVKCGRLGDHPRVTGVSRPEGRASNLITRLCLCALLFLMALVAACNDKAAKFVAPTPRGTRVEIPGGSYVKIEPQELQTLLADKKFPLINVHVPYEGEIEKTDANIPYNEIEKIVDKLPSDKNAMVVIYCRSGPMSRKATEALVTLGYTNVWHMDRGMVGWKEAGFPIVIKKQP